MKPNRCDAIIFDLIEYHTIELFFIIVTILAVMVRIAALRFASNDMTYALLPWFDQIREFGIRHQIGDYNLLYQTIIFLMTKIPISATIQYKFLSGIFDFFLAWNVAYLLKYFDKSSIAVVLGYAGMMFLPTVILNSAVWGQCDSIYTAFVILTLNLLLRKQYSWAFFALGIALSFKLQAVFIFPALFYLYFLQKRFSVFSFCYTFLGFYIPCLPAAFVRRDPIAPMRIYQTQIGEYKEMFMNYPSFWTLIGSDYDTLSRIAILTTVVVLGIGLLLIMRCDKKMDDRDILRLCAFSVWSCLLFLPAMHERYGYMLDVLLLILAFLDLRWAVFSFLMVLTSCSTYGVFLFGNQSNLPLLTCISLILYAAFSVNTFTRLYCSKEGGNYSIINHQCHIEEEKER